MLHNYLNTKSLIMGFWSTVIYIFISLKPNKQNVQKTKILYFTTHENINKVQKTR